MQFCYALTSSGRDDYARMAYVSAELVRRVYPSAQITVIVDEVTEAALVRERARIVNAADEVVRVQTGLERPVDRSRVLKTTLRQTVRGDFLFLDTDALVIDRMDRMFCGRPHMAAVLDRHEITLGYVFPKHAAEYSARFGWRSPLPRYFNSGVVFWADTPLVHRFGEEYHRRWRMIYEATGDHRDQAAFNSALDALEVPVRVMPPRFNAMVELSSRFCWGAAVFHYFTNGGSPRPGTLLHHLIERVEATGEIDWKAVERAASWKCPWIGPEGQVLGPLTRAHGQDVAGMVRRFTDRYRRSVMWNFRRFCHVPPTEAATHEARLEQTVDAR
jgi:hypothetical protein